MYLSQALVATVPLAFSCLSYVSAAPHYARDSNAPAVNTTVCNGKTYVYEELAGYGKIPGNARDKEGDTIGGIGSSITIDPRTWQKVGNSYTGILYAVPDRGWNTEGTLNYQARIQVPLLFIFSDFEYGADLCSLLDRNSS